ncbi:MAG: thioredoxin family protein [Bacteroidia bacterium]
MRTNILFATLLFLTIAANAQNKEILFEKTELKAALAKAKAQKKPVFVDCYTTWCGPCKGMDATVFKTDSVADFFNSKFINVKLDMEKGEGPAAGKTYQVGAYPTYLLFDENGNQIYKFVGGMPANEFMAKIRIGINPKNEIATREARYAAGDRDHALLSALIKQKFKQKEIEPAKKLTAEYFALLSPNEKVLPENWFLFGESFESMYISALGSTNFTYLLAHYKAFSNSIGKEIVDRKIYASYKKLAENCLSGYYFKNHPYSSSEFDGYTEQVNKSQFEDKNQLLALVAIAKAAGQKDAKVIGNLLESHLASFTQENMNIVFAYTTFCSSNDRTYPNLKAIAELAINHSKNPYLVNFCKGSVERMLAPKSTANE